MKRNVSQLGRDILRNIILDLNFIILCPHLTSLACTFDQIFKIPHSIDEMETNIILTAKTWIKSIC